MAELSEDDKAREEYLRNRQEIIDRGRNKRAAETSDSVVYVHPSPLRPTVEANTPPPAAPSNKTSAADIYAKVSDDRTKRLSKGTTRYDTVTEIETPKPEVKIAQESDVSAEPSPAPAPAKKARAPAKPRKPKMQELSLEELYSIPSITPSVFKCILEKEDFSTIKPDTYCAKVCAIPCSMKMPSRVNTNSEHVNVMIIQESYAMEEKFKSADRVEGLHQRQIASMIRPYLDGLSFRVHNLVKCKPVKIFKDGKLKKLTFTQKVKCSPYLLKEILDAKPDVIVSLNTDVTKALGIKRSNYKDRGDIHYTGFEVDGRRIPVVITLHPNILNMIRQTASGKMYGPDFYGVIRNDMKKAADIAKGLYRPIPRELLKEHIEEIAARHIVNCRDLDTAINEIAAIASLPRNKLISWDLETTSLDPWSPDARILSCHFAYRQDSDGLIRSITIPLWHRDNHYYDPDDIWPHISELLQDPSVLKVGHNVKFDIVFTEVTMNIDVKGVLLDTMLLMHSINSGIQGNYSLKTAVSDWCPHLGLTGYEELLGFQPKDSEDSAGDEDEDS